jgi:predicted RNA binding protein YcfA (HicA-like mRNA interferase family)
MPKIEKLIEKILSGKSDANISFSDLRKLMLSLGFHERTKGSHHIFVKENVVELVNLQKDGSMAKPYQVRQVRQILVTYRLGGDD